MADQEKMQRMKRLAEVLENQLVNGDEFQVVATRDEVLVTETKSFLFQEKHPRLYGRLLSLNEQMSGGCLVTLFGFVLAVAISFALNVGWLDDLLGAQGAEKLNSWWFFVLLFLVVFAVTGAYYDWQEKKAYRRGREELLLLLQAADLDRDTLLMQLKGDPDLEKVIKQLMLDPGPFFNKGL